MLENKYIYKTEMKLIPKCSICRNTIDDPLRNANRSITKIEHDLFDYIEVTICKKCSEKRSKNVK